MRPPLFLLSINKLISNYTHIGFKRQQTNNYFRKAIIGTYSGASIIDPASTLSNLRLFTRFACNLIINQQKICLVAYSVPKHIQRRVHLYGHYFMYNNWPAGLITNFRRVYKNRKARTRGYLRTIPAALILFDLPPQKSLDIVNEAREFLLPVFSFLDSNVDLSLYPYWIPTNLKSGYAKTFLLRYISLVFKRAYLLKKYMFKEKAIHILGIIQRERARRKRRMVANFLKQKQKRSRKRARSRGKRTRSAVVNKKRPATRRRRIPRKQVRNARKIQ